MNNNHRYSEKPFQRLLECYVLRTIGKLTREEESTLEEMSPKLCEVYNLAGEWHEIVATVMNFPDALPAQVKTIWEKNCELANAKNEELNPQDFVEMFVDQNFEH